MDGGRRRLLAQAKVPAAVAVLLLILVGSGCTTQNTLTAFKDTPAPTAGNVVPLFFGPGGLGLDSLPNGPARFQTVLGRQPAMAFATPIECLADDSTQTEGCSTRWGSGFKVPSPLSLGSDMGAELYVNSTRQTILNAIEIKIFRNDETVPLAVLNTGSEPALPMRDAANTLTYGSLTTAAKAVFLAGGVAADASTNLAFKAGDRLNVNLTVWGAAAAGSTASVTDINLLFGTTRAPSMFYFTTPTPPATVPTGSALREYFTADSLVGTAPASSDNQTRSIAAANIDPNSAKQWTWGSFVSPVAGKVSAPATVTFWIDLSYAGTPTAAAQVGVVANLTIGTKVYKGIYGFGAIVWDKTGGANTVKKIVVPVPTRNATLAVGTQVTLSFLTYGIAKDELGSLQVIYGSASRPSGVVLPLFPVGGTTVAASTSAVPSPLTSSSSPATTATSVASSSGPTLSEAGRDGAAGKGANATNGSADGGVLDAVPHVKYIDAQPVPATSVFAVAAAVCATVAAWRRR